MRHALRSDLAEEVIAQLPPEECARLYKSLRYRWPLWARPKQLPPPGDWDVWGLVAGRGGGKTRPGAEWTIKLAKENPGARMAVVARSSADARDTIVKGESGIEAQSPPWFRPKYFPSKRLVLWPNGFEVHLYTDAEPDLLRGPQHHFGWGDEFAAWRNSKTLTNLQDGLRLGLRPRLLLTSTPRRIPLFVDTFLGPKNADGQRPVSREMIESGKWEFVVRVKDDFGRDVEVRTVVARWRTEENSLNLSPGFAARRRAIYADSSYGRMELDADIQEIVEGALFTLQLIDAFRLEESPAHTRRVVSVDPSHGEAGRNDECGIIVAGVGPAPSADDSGQQHGYVIADRSLRASPNAWGHAAMKAYDEFRADLIVYEDNESPGKPSVVRDVIRTVDPTQRIRWQAIHASRDKRARADPVASLYESGRVHHVANKERTGHLAALEEEMVGWDPWDPKAKSPNRLDALVHGLSYLLLQGLSGPSVAPLSVGRRRSHWRN